MKTASTTKVAKTRTPGLHRNRLLTLGLAITAMTATVASAADTRLVDAVKARNESTVRSLVAERVDVNAAAVDGTTPLHYAVADDATAVVDMLIAAGAQVNAANRYGVRPLTLACENGNGAIIERLLKAGADPNTAQSKGETALMTAARAGTVDGVNALLARGAAVNTHEGWRGQTALMWAAAEGHARVVSLLLDHGAEISARSTTGFTALLFAAREGRIEVVRTLLDRGAPLDEALRLPPSRQNTTDEKIVPDAGSTAFMLASGNAHYQLAAMLLDRGADANQSPKGWTALHQLTWVRKAGIAGSNNPAPEGSGTMTSLEFARALVRHGADVNARVLKKPPVGVSGLNMIGGTPFLLAARTADVELMKLLVELGADPKATNADRTTPLMVAAGIGTYAPGEDPGTEPEVLEATKLALQLGNDINAVDDLGQTAMHGAASKHAPSVVRFLAQSGAKIDIWNQPDKEGFTPLKIAQGILRGMNIVRSAPTEAAIREVMLAAHVQP
jgi:ankyrin repeat protein